MKVHRSNLRVADMERALAIYRDILGFQVDFLGPTDEAGVMGKIFDVEPTDTTAIAFLSDGGGEFGTLALTEVVQPEFGSPRNVYSSALIIEVAEGALEPIVQRLRDAGLEVGEPVELQNPHRLDISITDPDGHRLVLFEVYADAQH